MNVFPYELALGPQATFKENYEFSLEGVARALTPGLEEDGADEAPMLGFRLFDSEEMALVLLEDRARMEASIAGRRREAGFSLNLRWSDLAARRLYLLVSFLYEGKYWFFEKDIAPKRFVLEREGQRISCCAKSEAAPAAPGLALAPRSEIAPAWCSSRAPATQGEFSRQIEAIHERFGLKVALTFGYHYALGRPPDPYGLNEKMREIATGRMTIGQTCQSLLDSDEFKRRNLELLPHPARVIGPWARLGATAAE